MSDSLRWLRTKCKCGGPLVPMKLASCDMSAHVGYKVEPIQAPGRMCDACHATVVDAAAIEVYVAGFRAGLRALAQAMTGVDDSSSRQADVVDGPQSDNS